MTSLKTQLLKVIDSIGSNSQSVCKKVISIQQNKIDLYYSAYLKESFKISNISIYRELINLK